jgi:hypothetical protein
MAPEDGVVAFVEEQTVKELRSVRRRSLSQFFLCRTAKHFAESCKKTNLQKYLHAKGGDFAQAEKTAITWNEKIKIVITPF